MDEITNKFGYQVIGTNSGKFIEEKKSAILNLNGVEHGQDKDLKIISMVGYFKGGKDNFVMKDGVFIFEKNNVKFTFKGDTSDYILMNGVLDSADFTFTMKDDRITEIVTRKHTIKFIRPSVYCYSGLASKLDSIAEECDIFNKNNCFVAKIKNNTRKIELVSDTYAIVGKFKFDKELNIVVDSSVEFMELSTGIKGKTFVDDHNRDVLMKKWGFAQDKF